MAFPAAVGHNNLPNGNFSPVIFSKKVQLAFRQEAVCMGITNNDYFGEIANYGDSVRILKEPTVFVSEYFRGTQVQTQDLIDEDFTLIVDKGAYYGFRSDDIEVAHSHVNWQDMAASQAAYQLKMNLDRDILGYMSGYKQASIGAIATVARTAADIPGTKALDSAGDDELLAYNKLNKGKFSNITTSSAGDHSIPLAARLSGETALPTAYASPSMVLNRMGRILDEQNIPSEGRWVVVAPTFVEILRDEGNRLLNADWGKSGGLRNGKVTDTPIYGFNLHVSNNLPVVGTGPNTAGTANQNDNFGVIVAGTNAGVAMAEQITKSEKFRSQTTFGDIYRGLQVYGRKVIKPEVIVTAKWNVA